MSSQPENNGSTLLWRIFQIANLTTDEGKKTFGYITTTITNAVISTICKAFGVENLTELTVKLNPANQINKAIEAITKGLDGKLKAALADPTKYKPLVEAIAMDAEAQRILVNGCSLDIAKELRMLLDNMPQELIEKIALAVKKQEGKESSSKNPTEDLAGLSDFAGETESETK